MCRLNIHCRLGFENKGTWNAKRDASYIQFADWYVFNQASRMRCSDVAKIPQQAATEHWLFNPEDPPRDFSFRLSGGHHTKIVRTGVSESLARLLSQSLSQSQCLSPERMFIHIAISGCHQNLRQSVRQVHRQHLNGTNSSRGLRLTSRRLFC